MAYVDLADIFDPAPDASPPAEWGDQIRDNFEALAAIVLGLSAAAVSTSESRSDASYGDLATPGPSVGVVTGERAVVFIGANMSGSSGSSALMSFEVSGASMQAASDNTAVNGIADMTNFRNGMLYVIEGLTPGLNIFTAKYRRSLGGTGTATFAHRQLFVVPLP